MSSIYLHSQINLKLVRIYKCDYNERMRPTLNMNHELKNVVKWQTREICWKGWSLKMSVFLFILGKSDIMKRPPFNSPSGVASQISKCSITALQYKFPLCNF